MESRYFEPNSVLWALLQKGAAARALLFDLIFKTCKKNDVLLSFIFLLPLFRSRKSKLHTIETAAFDIANKQLCFVVVSIYVHANRILIAIRHIRIVSERETVTATAGTFTRPMKVISTSLIIYLYTCTSQVCGNVIHKHATGMFTTFRYYKKRRALCNNGGGLRWRF